MGIAASTVTIDGVTMNVSSVTFPDIYYGTGNDVERINYSFCIQKTDFFDF